MSKYRSDYNITHLTQFRKKHSNCCKIISAINNARVSFTHPTLITAVTGNNDEHARTQWRAGVRWGRYQRYLGRGSEGVGAAFVGVVHELLQVLEELQQQSETQLVGVVTFIALSSAPLTQLLLTVQTVSRQTADHPYNTHTPLSEQVYGAGINQETIDH